jgi:tRNA (Thr-GGU) A37 N-methylase
MMEVFNIEAIGRVHGGRSKPEDDDWGASKASIVLDPVRFGRDALLGLDQFSHAEIVFVFVFDRVELDEITFDARHPRGRQD